MDAAPRELFEALDAWRCRLKNGAHLEVVAVARVAREGGEVLGLGPMPDRALAELCRTVGIVDDDAIAGAARASGGSPGWLVASVGRVPLTRDTVLNRVRGLSRPATESLATIALFGGAAVESLCDLDGMGELLEASLISLHVRT